MSHTELDTLIEIKNLIDNDQLAEAKNILHRRHFSTGAEKLFQLQLLVIKGKSIPEQKICEFLNYDDKYLGEVIHSLLGDYYFSKNKFGNALTQYEKCLDKNPGNIHANLGSANSLQSMGMISLSEKKYLQMMPLYTWKKDLLSEDAEVESNSDTNSSSLTYLDFEFLPRDLLLNMGLLYYSLSDDLPTERDDYDYRINFSQIFQYLIDTFESPDDSESRSLIEILEFPIRESEYRNEKKSGFIEQIKNIFPYFYKENYEQIKDGKFADNKTSKKLTLKSEKYIITHTRNKRKKIYSCIPTTPNIDENITSHFYLYLKKPDEVNLEKLFQSLGISSNHYDKEMILKYWLNYNNDLQSLVYLQKSIIEKNIEKDLSNELPTNEKNLYVRKIINSQLIWKALNENWKHVDANVIINQVNNPFKDYLIAKSLVNSIEDYSQFLKTTKEINSTTIPFSLDGFGYLNRGLLQKIKNIDMDLSKIISAAKETERKKLEKKQLDFNALRKRLKKIDEYHKNPENSRHKTGNFKVKV